LHSPLPTASRTAVDVKFSLAMSSNDLRCRCASLRTSFDIVGSMRWSDVESEFMGNFVIVRDEVGK